MHVVVGNTAPKVDAANSRRTGSCSASATTIPFKVKVTDPEDGDRSTAPRSRSRFILGHDSHGHPMTSANGCTGTIQTSADGGHDPNANIFGVFDAEYTDGGGGGQAALTTPRPERQSSPRHRQAEHFNNSSGVTVQSTRPRAHGGKTVGDIDNGDWISFKPYVLTGATKLTARVSSGGAGGFLEVRAGSPTGRSSAPRPCR